MGQITNIDKELKARKKAYDAGRKCAANNTRLNDLRYFDLANSIDPDFDLKCQQWALLGFQREKELIHCNQLELPL